MEKRTKKYCRITVLTIFAIITIIVMYVFGMSDLYTSPPLDIGFGQYLDIKAGVICICFVGIGFIIYFSLRKRK